jgi:hypothetical protein
MIVNVMPQFGATLTDNSRVVIRDLNDIGHSKIFEAIKKITVLNKTIEMYMER